MNYSINVIRGIMVGFAMLGGFMVQYLFGVSSTAIMPMLIGLLIGLLLVLVDVLLKGFSLRALTGLTFGLGVGLLIAHFISISPLFKGGDPQVVYISQLAVFIGATYLSTVIALRGKDEFNLVIPYVRFQSEKVEVPLVALDTSSLVDGRVFKLCQARMLSDELMVPKFVLDELNDLAASLEGEEQNRGRRGLQTLMELRALEHVDVRIFESEVEKGQSRDDKMLFVVSSSKGRLLSASEYLVEKAKQQGVPYVDLLGLAKAMAHEVAVGAVFRVKIVKLGKEDSQGVGYLEDGSMVVANNGAGYLNAEVLMEVDSIVPTSGGRIVFGKLLGQAA